MKQSSAIEYIGGFSRTGKRVLGLSRISSLLSSLGEPQNKLKFVHIAGTNGKGSTLEYASSMLMDAGYKTGQFTSPFVEKFNDRIRINGKNIPDSRLNDICFRIKNVHPDENCSQFELTLAAALIYFCEEKCDIVFLETGIGGTLDATNIIESPLLSVITSVSLDHTQILGSTVAEIAVQKAGIIKHGCPVVLSIDNVPDTIKIVKDKAESLNSTFVMPAPDVCTVTESDINGSCFFYKNGKYRINMCGRHQISNALTAIETAKLLQKCGFEISEENIRNGLAASKVCLRAEILCEKPLVIADGGHNISGIDSLVGVIEKLDRPLVGLVGMVRGKAEEYAGQKLSEMFDTVVCTDGFIDNSIPAEELAEYFDIPCEVSCFENALQTALSIAKRQNASLIICGSLYLASAMRREFFRTHRGNPHEL